MLDSIKRVSCSWEFVQDSSTQDISKTVRNPPLFLFATLDRCRADPPQLVDEEKQAKVAAMSQKFLEYSPNMKGMVNVEESVNDVLKVIREATMEKNGGRLVSHFGNRQWL